MPPQISSSELPADEGISAGRTELSVGDIASAGVGVLTLVLTAVALLLTRRIDHLRAISSDIDYARASLRSYEVMIGVLVGGFFLEPLLVLAAAKARQRWRKAYTALALLAACAFLCVFIVSVGRHQFGAWDFDIIMEEGWRQILGQREYVELLSPTPPGFNLGIKYAFEIFGVTWDANLYLSAIFASGTFLWIYWLMLQMETGTLAAMGTAFAIECETMLLLSFWWYNNTALVMGTVFLLACIAYLRRPRSLAIQISYAAALTLLALMKPNIGGIAIPGGVILVLIASERRWRVVALTLGSVAAVLLLFAINHISVLAMLASYHEVSKLRGGFSDFGFQQMGRFERCIASLALIVLSLPWLWLLPRTLRMACDRNWRGVALHFFFPLALFVSIYAVRTNGDFWLVECPPLLALGALVIYGLKAAPLKMRRFFASMLLASIAASLYIGAARLRVFTIGPHMFFEWADNENLMESGALKHMRVSQTMVEVQRQMKAAVGASPGPYFFGPRMNYNYMLLGLPSPKYLPTFWQPGVAFGMDQEPQLVQVWKNHKFETLIFLKGNYTFYPPELLAAIASDYRQDNRYPSITVYHRRSGSE